MSAMEVKKTQIPAKAQQTTIKETTDVNKNISIFEDKNVDGPSQKKIDECLDATKKRWLEEQNKTQEQKEKDALISADKMINSFKKSLEKVKGNEKASERIQQNINKYEAVKAALTDNSPELKSSEKFQKLKQDYCNSKNEEKFLNEYNKLKEELKSSKPKQAQQPKAAQQPVQPKQVNKPQQTQAPAAKKEAVKAETANPKSTEQQLKTEVAELNKKVDEVKDTQKQAFAKVNIKALEQINGKPFTDEEREQKLKELNSMSMDDLIKQTDEVTKQAQAKRQGQAQQTQQTQQPQTTQQAQQPVQPQQPAQNSKSMASTLANGFVDYVVQPIANIASGGLGGFAIDAVQNAFNSQPGQPVQPAQPQQSQQTAQNSNSIVSTLANGFVDYVVQPIANIASGGIGGFAIDAVQNYFNSSQSQPETQQTQQQQPAQPQQPQQPAQPQQPQQPAQPQQPTQPAPQPAQKEEKPNFHSIKTGGMTWEGIIKTYYPELVDKCGGKMFGKDGAIRQLKMALSEGSDIDLVNATDIPKTLNLPLNLGGVELKDSEYKGDKIRKLGGHTDIAEAGRKTYSA